jgi:sterol desaturase/sphingolipid hydroxylase (fatty acid hydroxylase superfamily)
MISLKLKPGKNIRLFKNPILETLTYVHPIMPALFWIPVIIFCIHYSALKDNLSNPNIIFFTFFGLFFWTFAEYTLHRFVFHFKPKTPFQKRIEFLIHGIHHEDPDDQRRLLMPVSAAIIIAIILYSLFYIVLGSIYVKPFFAGFLIGYLIYDYIHFATHYFTLMDSVSFLRKLKQNHMKHHFSKVGKLYGVSSPLWDYIFNTLK